MNAHDPDLHRAAPNNLDAEVALLGAIMVNNLAYERVSPFLEAEHFFEPLHQRIYSVMGDMIRQGKAVTPVLLKSYLPADAKIRSDLTVAQYLVRIATEAVTVVLARDYAQAIHEMWVRRQGVVIAEDVVNVIYDLPVDADVLAELAPLEDRLATLRAQRLKGESRIGAGRQYLDNMTAAKQRGQARGVPICLEEIKTVLSEPCFEAGNLYGLLSSSGEGKTSLMLQIVRHALGEGHPVQILSYDQSGEQFIRQMVAQEYAIEARRQRFGDLAEKEWGRAVDFANWIDNQPFEVVKCTNQGAAALVGYARTFVKRYRRDKEPLVIVDHIGSVEPEDKRADEGTKAKGINKIFKAGAEATDGPWLILNQRNTWGMKRDNPRPIGADLFGGDPAKQAYDAILYLYRFLKFCDERKATASSDADWKKIHKVFPMDVVQGEKDIAELGAIKVRFGPPNLRETLNFEARYTRYVSQRQQDSQRELL